MKTEYLVIFDGGVEKYCKSLKSAIKTIDEMVIAYCCDGLSEQTLRKDTLIFKTIEIKLKDKKKETYAKAS